MQVNLIFRLTAFEKILQDALFTSWLFVCLSVILFMTIHEPWSFALMDAEFSYFRIGRQYPIRIISLVLYPDISDILSVI